MSNESTEFDSPQYAALPRKRALARPQARAATPPPARNLAVDDPFYGMDDEAFIIDDGSPDPVEVTDDYLYNPVTLMVDEKVVISHMRGLTHNSKFCELCKAQDSRDRLLIVIRKIREAVSS